jgi:hypothetical protein
MTYAAERDAMVKTPQAILSLAVTRCANWYATQVLEELWVTEEPIQATWIKSAGITVTTDTTTAPDGGPHGQTIAFAAAGDNIKDPAIWSAAASNVFTGSVFLKASASGTLTIDLHDTPIGEIATVVVNVTTAWQRFWIHKSFTAGAGGAPYLRLRRQAGDLASVFMWGANMTKNPVGGDQEIRFPYTYNFASNPLAGSCRAADAGNGARCYYAPGGCQDPIHFNPGNDYEATPELQGLREYKFCLKQAPMPIKGALIRPMLVSHDQAAQEIDGIRGAIDDSTTGGFVTKNEEVTYNLEDDENPGPWDLDKAAIGALTNTMAVGGSFFLRWLAIHPNYDNPRGYARLATGFVFPGAVEADFRQRMKGPILNVSVDSDGKVSVKATDGLGLTKFKIPAAISDSNLLQGPITSSQTTISVDDPSEISDPAPNAAAAETFDANGVRTGGPDWTVTLVFDSEKMNVISKTDGGNPITVTRGRWGTAAAAHANRIAFQEVAEFGTEQTVPGNPVLGMNYLDAKVVLYRRAGIPAAVINKAVISAEQATWCYSSIDNVFGVTSGTLCRRTVTDPTEIDQLLQEIDRDLVSYQFVDESGLVTTKVFAPPTPATVVVELTDVTNFIERTVSFEDIREARLSRIVVGWDLIPGNDGSKLSDYLQREVAIEQEQETPGFFGAIRDRVMLSQWIPASDKVQARAIASRMLARFRQGARLVVGHLEAKDDDNVTIGSFVYGTTRVLQKPDGTPDRRLLHVVKKERDADGSRMSITFLDTAILHRTIFIAPNGQPDYNSATEAQRRYWYIGDANNKVGTAKDDGYYVR